MSARGPRRRCPDCNGRPQGLTVQHRPGCPLRAALEDDARRDAAHLRVPGAHYLRGLTETERTELGWLRPDLNPDDYRVLVALLDRETRVRGYVRQTKEDS